MMQTRETQFVEALREWVQVFMQHSMNGFLAHARAQKLSMSQLGTLMHIHRMGTCGVGDISGDLGVSNAAVSQLLDRLVETGLVERQENPDDRRAKRIELTDRGLQMIRDTIESRQRWFGELAALLSDEDLTTAVSSLQLMTQHARSIQ